MFVMQGRVGLLGKKALIIPYLTNFNWCSNYQIIPYFDKL